MNRIISLIAISWFTIAGYAQEVDVIEMDPAASGISYYDIFPVAKATFWVVGQQGTIRSLDAQGNVTDLGYNGTKKYLLKVDTFSQDHVIVCGEEGTVINYYRQTDSWETIKVPGFEDCSFYDICILNDQEALIGGGRTSIVKEKRRVPHGFVLYTKDGGKTWSKVMQTPSKMVWSVEQDKQSGEIFALTYSLFGSRLYRSSDGGQSWRKHDKKHRALYHDFEINEQQCFVGGKSTLISKNKLLYRNGTVSNDARESSAFQQAGMIWSIKSNATVSCASASNGYMIYRQGQGDWKVLNTGVRRNLYEAAFIDAHTLYLIGSKQTILKVNLNNLSSDSAAQ